MNLPQLTAYLGSLVPADHDPLEAKVKSLKTKIKSEERPYAVFLTFDLERQSIRIEDPIPFSKDILYEYGYFGNNDAAQLQSYLVREVESLHYLLTSVWNDLRLALQKHNMGDSRLSKWIEEMEASELLVTGNKKGRGKVCLDRFQLPGSLEGKSVTLQKENRVICIGSQKFKYEAFVHAMLEHENKKDRFVLVIPAVFEQGVRIVLSQHEDYRKLVRKINNLELPEEREEDSHSSEQRVCYVCQQLKPSVKSEYTTKFSRTGINKVFTTTTINSARYKTDGYSYDDAYAICLECYRHLVNGEALIEKRFKGSIARESAFFLPEGLFEPFDYDSIGRIKDRLDFAFQCKEAGEWLEMVEADAEWMQHPYFTIHIIVYRTDGTSFTVLETIEDVPALRFMQIMKTIRQASGQLKPFLQGMSLGNIYRMVPIRETKKGEQVNVGRVLSLYKALFSGYRIRSETLFDYASEALDKGILQLSKEKIDNYRNMGLDEYHPDKVDFFIQRMAMQYLALIQVFQQLAILDRPVFTPSFGTEEQDMQLYDSVEAVEQFLDRQGFSSEAKALFYLGCMIHRVGVEQYKKGHKTKPVLKKIHFQGMSASEVYRLYYDVLDKLRQYDAFDRYSETLIEGFHRHCGILKEREWPLSDHANVFYIMSGYAYQVGALASHNKGRKQDGDPTESGADPAIAQLP
ncbi:TM1802 family CRISPR-associated protein [Geobacillus proteiniphilus]|uniref:CRISPR-associated protein, Csh1 family n=1 Tax=Geobacillus proteiniphilus TaxID=860353 RepID=A0A1Q5T4X2_9BACL|nr:MULTISPECIES: TM1802 family CRISPR-associated protein [Geobacillus]OKO95268.1 CRISPR-associated protein, Csh1 family [Geobacillus proteiniphilus]OPX04212.1 hypothetical protein B1A75_03770 [Geobacillus sp. LEMMY01]WMJ15912.1 TM1802 family CRISPR-associated protein [Geobacillus proteiniphilus]